MRSKRGIVLALAVASCGGKLDDDPTGSGRSKATGAPADPAASGTGSTGGPGSPAVVRPACALKTPIRQDFDKGFALDDDWGGAPGGLQFDSTTPISGAQSLKIDVARALMYRGFLVRSLPASCALTMKLSIRSAAPLFANGENATIVRLVAMPAFFDLVLGEKGSVSLVEVTEAQGRATVPGGGGGPMPAPSVGNAHPIGSLPASVTTSIVVTLDLSTNELSGSVSPTGTPPSGAAPSKLTVPHGDLTGVTVGLFTGSAKSGTYWLDDFSLE